MIHPDTRALADRPAASPTALRVGSTDLTDSLSPIGGSRTTVPAPHALWTIDPGVPKFPFENLDFLSDHFSVLHSWDNGEHGPSRPYYIRAIDLAPIPLWVRDLPISPGVLDRLRQELALHRKSRRADCSCLLKALSIILLSVLSIPGVNDGLLREHSSRPLMTTLCIAGYPRSLRGILD